MNTERRATKQRAAIRTLLGQTSEFKTAQQLHRLLSEEGSTIGMATVYRALQAMTESGELDVVRTADGESAYRRCANKQHHHHLVCRRCGTTVEISADQLETWAVSVAEQHGFTKVDHDFELFGLCRTCTLNESGSE